MNIFAKGALAAAAAATALASLAVPGAASAQAGYYDRGPGPYGGGYYDPCRRDTTQRGTTGALVGGGLGAVIGSGIASRGVRTEGAVLGGLLGAAVGASVGQSSAACSPGAYPPPPPPPEARSSYEYEYDPQPYAGGYAPSRYEYEDDYYEQRGYASSVADGVGADGCTLAESPIYLPDGQVQKRFVRVCRDASGRYQVVD